MQYLSQDLIYFRSNSELIWTIHIKNTTKKKMINKKKKL